MIKFQIAQKLAVAAASYSNFYWFQHNATLLMSELVMKKHLWNPSVKSYGKELILKVWEKTIETSVCAVQFYFYLPKMFQNYIFCFVDFCHT